MSAVATETPYARMVVDGVPAVLPRPRVRLPDGAWGWYQLTNTDDGGCLAAAVATCVQIPLAKVGPLGSVGDLYRWADARGYEFAAYFDELPDAERWLGFTPPATTGRPT